MPSTSFRRCRSRVTYCRSARIRVISPDRKSFRFITSPAMKHAATIAVVEASL
jgi:hypothetical protein